MPGNDIDLEAEALDRRLMRLLHDSADGVERQAREPRAEPEAIARKVGVIARSGAALALMRQRQRRARASVLGGADPTEEADMDDAEDAGAPRPHDADDDEAHDDAAERRRLERDLRALARNLRIPGADGGGGAGAGGACARGDLRELVDARARAPAPA